MFGKFSNLIYSLLIISCIVGYHNDLFEARYYNGSVNDHFDGKKFYNIQPSTASRFAFLKWIWQGRGKTWPNWYEHKTYVPNKIINGNNLTISLVNHSTFLIQTNGINILTDPVWGEHAGPWIFGPKRVTNPGIKFSDLPNIHIVLISHNHYDHLDIMTIKKLQKKFNPLFITPLGVSNGYLKNTLTNCNCHELDWWGKIRYNKDVSIYATPARHWSRRTLFDKNSSLWCGFVIKINGINLYFAGDTGFGDGSIFEQIKQRFGTFELAMLPIGAYEPRWFMKDTHISPKEAVDIFKILGARYAVGMHYGTFHLSNESINQPIHDLKYALHQAKIPERLFKILEFGKPWTVIDIN